MAEAYSAFANEGKREDGHIITKIVGPTGKIIVERKPKVTKVTDKKTANEMTSMLLNVMETGTGKGANVSGYQIAGKTGSTQVPFNNIDGTADQWFVGYTPNLVGAVWIGYDKTDREHYLYGLSAQGVVPVFQSIMQNTLKYTKAEKFETESINSQMQKKYESDHPFKTKAKELNEKLKQGTEKLKEKLEDGKSKWKILEEKIKNKLKQFKGE